MEGAMPAAEAEPGTLKVSLAATPRMSSPVSHAVYVVNYGSLVLSF